jgi:hypothetical protein
VSEVTRCTYCGVPATGRDHVIPQNLRGRMENWYEKTVPSCGECNSLMSTYDPGHTIATRRAYVKAQLRRRYATALQTPEWSEAQLRALGFHLRRCVETRLRLKAITRKRLAWRSPPPLPEPTQRRHPRGRTRRTRRGIPWDARRLRGLVAELAVAALKRKMDAFARRIRRLRRKRSGIRRRNQSKRPRNHRLESVVYWY